MKKRRLTEGILTSVFKVLFKGKVDVIEKALRDDPILKQQVKKIHKNLDELTKYVEDNFGENY